MDKNKTLLEGLKKYFAETPREQVLKDWAETKERTKGIKSPTVKEFLEITTQFQGFSFPTKQTVIELEMPESNDNYIIIDSLGSGVFKKDSENYKGC